MSYDLRSEHSEHIEHDLRVFEPLARRIADEAGRDGDVGTSSSVLVMTSTSLSAMSPASTVTSILLALVAWTPIFFQKVVVAVRPYICLLGSFLTHIIKVLI